MKSKLKLILKWIFVVIWMFVIFFFSSMTGTDSNAKSKKTIDKALTETAVVSNNLKITNVNPESKRKVNIINKLNYPLRKCMHASIYCVLCVLFLNALRETKKLNIWYFIAIILCFIYACTDEYHQTFVNGRTGQFKDVLVDTSGAIFGSIIYFVFYKFKKVLKSNEKIFKVFMKAFNIHLKKKNTISK